MARVIDSGGGNWLLFIADKVKSVALKFKEINDDILNVPLLGKYLALPFWWVYFWLDLVQDGIRRFNSYYLDLVAGVKDALDYLGLNDAISNLFSEWQSLRLAPLIWVKNKLRDLIRAADDLFTNAGRWVLERVRDYSPEIYAWLIDFPKKYDDWLYKTFPSIYYLFHDPKGFLLDLANIISPDLGFLFRDPKGFIQNKLSLWLDLPPGFWADPRQGFWDWLLREFEERFTPLAPRVYKLAERILRYFWEGVF